MNYATRAWTTPGGRVEFGESPIDTLKREVLEESGLDVVVEELVGVYSKPYKDDISPVLSGARGHPQSMAAE